MATREASNDLGCSSSEEDSNRLERTQRTAERRRHPFSVEALMSGRKTDGRGGESTYCKPEGSSVAVSPLGLNSLYLCRETCSLPAGSRKSLTSSPVKSEASEFEDCASWITKSAFSTQPRKFLPHREATGNLIFKKKKKIDFKVAVPAMRREFLA